MISEKTIASQFHGFWEETLPLLTPSFVKVFNEASSEDLTDLPQSKFSYTPIGENIEKHDLVAELSFQIAKLKYESQISFDESRSRQNLAIAYRSAVDFLKRYKTDNPDEIVLNIHEIDESFNIACQYDYFFEFLGSDQIKFSPKLSGSGFLGECIADLSVANTLYEIKTVSRNISGKDIKQLIIYLALQFSSGNNNWSHAGFFNPRKSIHYKFSVDHLLYRSSGGRSAPDVFKDITDFLSSRELEIDGIF